VGVLLCSNQWKVVHRSINQNACFQANYFLKGLSLFFNRKYLFLCSKQTFYMDFIDTYCFTWQKISKAHNICEITSGECVFLCLKSSAGNQYHAKKRGANSMPYDAGKKSKEEAANKQSYPAITTENIMNTLRMDMHIFTYKHITFSATTVHIISMSPTFG